MFEVPASPNLTHGRFAQVIGIFRSSVLKLVKHQYIYNNLFLKTVNAFLQATLYASQIVIYSI